MALTAGNLTREEARQRAALVSSPRYHIALDLSSGDEHTFRSSTRLRFVCARPGATTFLDLSARRVERLEVNGTELDPDEHFDGSRLHLPALDAHNEVKVTAVGEFQHTGAGMHRAVDPVDGKVYLHTQFEPFDAHLVFACFDQPDLKAIFRFSVEAPAGWKVVSNTPVASRSNERWWFKPTPPLSTYVTALVAGPYHVVTDRYDDVPLAIYCRKSMTRHLDHEELFDLTKRGLQFFEDAFDYLYPFAKYDQLFVPEFNFGAMENPGCVTFSERHLFRGQVTEAERERRANTLLHEMAHMWFGDLVTMRWWDDLWLNESFATFMATLALSRATRFTNAWVTFANEEKAWARQQDQLPSTHPISTDVADVDAVHQNFDGITYAKGASVLRQLVAWVGEEQFLAGCRSYFRQFGYGNADLRSFLRHLEQASGRDLETWAKEWLRTAGLNTLIPTYDVDADRYQRLAVDQEAPADQPTLRSHRVAVGLYDLHDGRLMPRHRVEVDITGPSTEVGGLAGESVADLVLVNDGDLVFAKLHLDRRSLETVTERLSALDDPLARTLVWSSAWDMVRDAAMPARRFVELVRRNAAAEPDIGVLQTLFGRALTAAEMYGDPANAPRLIDMLASDARDQLDLAEPASDRQLVWARHWIAVARTPEHTTGVRALLDGRLRFDGLKVDAELRWHAVGALAGAGAIDDDAIAAEHRRDPTDFGERNAAAARAARPYPRAKDEAWQRVVGEPELSHSLMKAIMSGFRRRDQAGLLDPYVERYFDVLLDIWRRRQLEVALAFARSMYPTVVVEHATVARTDAYLRRRHLPAPLRRVLLEERDTVVRALRTRQLDATAG